MHEIKIWERKTPHVGGLPIAIRWGSKEGFFEKQGLSAHRRKNTESERRKMKEERGLFIHLAIEKFLSERWEDAVLKHTYATICWFTNHSPCDWEGTEVTGAPFEENSRMNLEVGGAPLEENKRMNLNVGDATLRRIFWEEQPP